MPCYVTYKIKTQIKATDVELFKTIAKEQNLRYTLERMDATTFSIVTTVPATGVMEELTIRKITKEAKKRNWKVKEIKQVQVKG
jgi:hypothetical protein|tara:strand:+ start:822 stop:1073 length:252 start_codon:yes stop_codon:yes gene_type:complete